MNIHKSQVIIMLFAIVISSISCNTKTTVDMIVTNATIYTVDSAMNVAGAMAIKNGKVIAAGTKEEIENKYTAAEIFDASGNYIFPGFIDAHCHFYGYGITKTRYADLTGTSSFSDVLKRVKNFAAKHPDNKWILGRGWDQNDWDKKDFPTRFKLDSLFPDKPVLLTRIDGHAVLVNEKALQIAGFDELTKIEGGELLKENGKLTGVLLDNAADKIKTAVHLSGNDEIEKALLLAQHDCFSVGLTSVVDAGLDKPVLDKIIELNRSGNLKMRIYAMLAPTQENFETYMKKGVYKTPQLHIASVKLYADGALGSRGACLLAPYTDDDNNYGFLVNTPAFLDSMCKIAYDNGYQVNTHAIGDSAVRTVLNIYSGYLQENNDRRWRIEHSQVVSNEDIDKYGKYNIIPSVNTTHATSDMYWAGERLGEERLKTAYAYHDLLQQNGWLTNGSDFPVESINPLYGFYAAVARKDLKGHPQNGFQPENALTREEALKSMTIWAAKGSFEEKEKGSLEPGKYADFVIVDTDIMKAPIEKIPDTKVISVFVGGKFVKAKE